MSAVNEDVKALHDAIDFGMEVQSFLQSRIGRYLVKRAEEEVEASVQLLKEADAEDPKAIRELQNKIKVAEDFQYWLGDAVQSGINAEREYVDSST